MTMMSSAHRDGVAQVVAHDQGGGAQARQHRAQVAPAAPASASRRASPAARPAAAPPAPAPACAPARRAGAPRPRARGCAGGRSRAGQRAQATARRPPRARPWASSPCAGRTRRSAPRFRCGNSASSWNMRPTPRRCGGRCSTDSPSISTSPASGRSSPAISRSTVVLPQPDGPSSAAHAPVLHAEGGVPQGDDALLESSRQPAGPSASPRS